jgi:exosortase A
MVAIDRREVTIPLLIGGVAAIVATIYANSFASMVDVWSYVGYRHGWVVVPISAFLVWRLRGALLAEPLRPWAGGLLAILPLVGLWFVARAVGVQAMEHFAIVALIPAAVATCLGTAIAKRALFPLLFLLAAVPVGDALVPHLMGVTADVATGLLRLVAVPVYREGQFISLPGGEFEVADVCSGLRYLIAGTMIALLFTYLTYRDYRHRVVFIAVTAVGLIVVNGIRAFIVMWVASATEMRVFGGDDHIYFGWALFAAVIGALFWVGSNFGQAPVPATAAAGEVRSNATGTSMSLIVVFGLVMLAVTAQPFRAVLGTPWLLLVPAGGLLLWGMSRVLGPVVSPAARVARSTGYPSGRDVLVPCMTTALLVTGPLLYDHAATLEPMRTPRALPRVAACSSPEEWAGSWRPEVQAADAVAAGSYRCPTGLVNAFIAGYSGNRQGAELVGDQNRVIDEEWRRYVHAGAYTLPRDAAEPVALNEVRVDGGGRRHLIWYWYVVGDRAVATAAAVKLSQVLQVIATGRSDGALYWIETPYEGTDASRSRLAPVASALLDAALNVPRQ